MNEHASRFALERHRLGESDAEARAHVERCAHCQDQLRALEAEDRAFMIVRPNLRSLGIEAKKKRTSWAPLLAIAACTAALALMVPREETRSKGGSHVELLVRRDGRTFGYEQQPLRPGDTLLFRCTTLRRHMLLAGVEDSGRVSIFAADVELEPGQGRLAPQGIELDDYPGRERVILLLSDAPLDRDEVERTLAAHARSAPLDTPHLDYDADQFTWLIERELP